MFNDLIGKPYRLGAKGPEAYDCWTLTVEAAKRFGVTVPEIDCTGLARAEIGAIADEKRHNIAYEIDLPSDGDVLLSLRLGHIGTVLHGMVLHTHRKHGVLLERMESFRAMYKDAQAYRWAR